MILDSTRWGDVEIIEVEGSHIEVALLFCAMTLANGTELWPVEADWELDYESILVMTYRTDAQVTIEFLRFLCDTEDITLDNMSLYAVQQKLPLWDETPLTYRTAFQLAFGV